MKIDQRVQEIWSGHESLTDGLSLTDEGHSYNPPYASRWGINKLGQGCHSISNSKFPDFSLTFNHFPDPFGRPILAIFIHRLFEDFAQIF